MTNTRTTPLRFPQSIPQFLLWVFFRPAAIYRYIYEIDTSLYGNDDPNLPILWGRRKKHPEFVSVISLVIFSTIFLSTLAFPIIYTKPNPVDLLIGIVAGVIFGLIFGVSAELGYFITLDLIVIVFEGNIWISIGLGLTVAIIIFFYQGLLAKQTQFERIAMDISNANDLDALVEIPNNLNSWLPDNMRVALAELLTSLDKSSQHARGVLETDKLSEKRQMLRNGISEIEVIMNTPSLAKNLAMTSTVIPALEKLKLLFEQELSKVIYFERIPNIYLAGVPLKRSLTFKGREDIFRLLSREFDNSSGQRPALLLFGARRVGKSSTLNQLSARLGDQIIPVIIDMQAETTVANISSFLTRIAEIIVSSAHTERKVELSKLDSQMERDPYGVFLHWLDRIEKEIGNRSSWMLIAIDEFETLGNMFSDGRIDERFFQIMRSLIQHRQRITILLCGAHTLEELPSWWSKYFINMKMLKVGRLKEAEAKELILRPTRKFPVTYDKIAVDQILYETGCHPNWLQHTCREIIDRLNQEKRLHANLEDATLALDSVPEGSAGDFIDLWEGDDSNDLMRSVLKFVSISKDGIVSEDELQSNFSTQLINLRNTLTFLTRRDILVHKEGRYSFNANLLRKWVAKR